MDFSLRKYFHATIPVRLRCIPSTMASGKKKFMGVVKLVSEGYTKARHLDIIDTDPTHFPFAVLYFTGSGGFNSKMRGEALKLGYSMNEYCLSDKNTKVPISSDIISDPIKSPEGSPATMYINLSLINFYSSKFHK